MSPASEPILVGSQAAFLRGCYPSWRISPPGDTDVVVAPGMAEAFARSIGADSIPSPIAGRHWLFRGGRLIEVDDRSSVANALLRALPDHERVEHLGVPMLAISATTQFAIKRAWDAAPYGAGKHQRDRTFFATLAAMQDCHHEFLDALCVDAAELFARVGG